VGTNLRERVNEERKQMEMATRTVLRFKNSATGAIVEFDAMATECWEDDSLEFVESVNIVDNTADMEYQDFVLFNVEGEDMTMEVLNRVGRIALLCINDAEAIDQSAEEAIKDLYERYPASAIYVVSSSEVDTKLPSMHLFVDAMTLRSIIRADVGIVVLRDGVVEYKDNI
jgi:hypothetical protein